MLGLAGIPAVVQFVGFLYLPESPRWLVDNGKEAQARAVLIRARGHENVDQELLEIRESCHETRKEQSLRGAFLWLRLSTWKSFYQAGYQCLLLFSIY